MTLNLSKLRNIKKASIPHIMIGQRPVPPPISKPRQYYQKAREKQKLNLSRVRYPTRKLELVPDTQAQFILAR